MKKLLFIISIIILSSCNSDEETTQSTNFYALTVGNSWIYKHYLYNNNISSFEETGVTDSISIISTEEIYGDTYYKFKQTTTNNNDVNGNYEKIYFLREYNDNLINEMNNLYFTHTNFEEIFIKKWLTTSEFYKLQENKEEITTNAGVFNCVFANRYKKNLNTNEINETIKIYYKEGIGLIKKVNINNDNIYSQVCLVSYTVN